MGHTFALTCTIALLCVATTLGRSLDPRKYCCEIEPTEDDDSFPEGEPDDGNVEYKYLSLTCTRKPGYSCFTVDKVPACRKGFKPARTWITFLPVACLPNSPETMAIKRQVLKGLKPPILETEDMSKMLLNLPRKCIPKKH